MKRKEDLRVKKTKKNLYEALIILLKDKSFEEIKVNDICSLSLTNRSTFYDHFNDKYELLASLIKDLESDFEEKLKEKADIKTAKDYYVKMIELLFDHISEHMDIYSSIIKNNNNSISYDMFFDTILRDIEKNLEETHCYRGKIPVEIITTFYVSAVIHVSLSYMKDPNRYKKEEILSYLQELLPKNIY